MSTAIADTSAPAAAPTQIWRPSAAINPERLNYLWGLAAQIAASSLVPLSLQGKVRNGELTEAFPRETVVANVFAVIEQADRWDYSPFALLSCAAIVYGKLGFEGKVISSVLETKFGIQLHAYYQGKPGTDEFRIYLCDVELPDDVVANLRPQEPPQGYRVIDGSVAEWRTPGNGSPWKPATYLKMLNYRGAREWARVYKSAAILGVLADDELFEIEMERRAQLAEERQPAARVFALRAQAAGFSADNITKALGHDSTPAMEIIDEKTGEVVEQNTGAQRSPEASKTQEGPKAPAQPTDKSAGGDGSELNEDSRSQTQPAGPAPTGAVLRDYHSALARMESEENVKKAHKAFWSGKGKGYALPEGSEARQLAVDIFDNHVARANGKVPADALATNVAEWITKYEGSML